MEIIVGIIVLAASAYVAWRFAKTFRKDGSGCSCGCETCANSKACEKLLSKDNNKRDGKQ